MRGTPTPVTLTYSQSGRTQRESPVEVEADGRPTSERQNRDHYPMVLLDALTPDTDIAPNRKRPPAVAFNEAFIGGRTGVMIVRP